MHKKKEKKNMKEENAITLVTLAVTIIILIILAGVSIHTLVGDNGIITKAKQARENITYAGKEEQKQLNQLYWDLEQIKDRENSLSYFFILILFLSYQIQ